jgi:hypothetical protein
MFLGLSRPIDIFWHFRFSLEVWQLFSWKYSVKVHVLTFTPLVPVCLEVAFLCSNAFNDTAFTLSAALLKPHFWNGLQIVVVCPSILFVFFLISLVNCLNETTLARVVTVEKSWCFLYDPETYLQVLQKMFSLLWVFSPKILVPWMHFAFHFEYVRETVLRLAEIVRYMNIPTKRI